MSRISRSAILVMMAALSIGCGTDDDHDPDDVDAGVAGSGGGSTAELDAGAGGDSSFLELCGGFEVLNACPVQVVLPTSGTLGAGGAGGAGGALSAARCTIPLELGDFNPNLVNLAVDCQVIPYCRPDYDTTTECWQYDDIGAPSAIVLNDALCARITEAGFESILIVAGCDGPIID